MNNRNNFSGTALIFSAGVLWGFVGLFVKQMDANGSTPVFTAFLRVFFAFFIMLALTLFRYGARAFRVDRRTLLYCALLGLVCHGIYNIFYSFAVTLSGMSVSAVLLNLAPIFTLAVSAVFLSEKITRLKAAAVIINVAGCILTAVGGQTQTGTFSAVGILCGIGSGFCYSLTAVFGRLAGRNTNCFVISTYSYLFAAAFLFVYMLFAGNSAAVNAPVLSYGFLLALFPTAIAYLIYYIGLQRLQESSRAPVIASVETAAAAALGIILYGEQLHLSGIAGMILVFLSISLMNRRKI